MTNSLPDFPARHDPMLSLLLVLGMALPMLLLYAVSALGPLLVRDLAIAPASLGYLTLSAFAVAAVLSLRAGVLLDRLGSRSALCLLFGAVALMFALMAVLPGFFSLLPVAALAGLAQALANPVTNQLIAQRVRLPQRAFMVGLKQSGVQLAALFAGLVLPVCALLVGWRGAFLLVAALAAWLVCCAWRLPALPSAMVRPQAATAPGRPLLLLMAIQCGVGMVLSAFVLYLPLHAVGLGLSATRAGGMLGLFGVMGMLSRLVLTPLGARLNEEAWLLAGLLLVSTLSIGLSLQADAGNLDWLWLGAAGVGLSAVATNALAMGMLVRDPRFGALAHTSGRVSAAFFAGMALGPVCSGMLIRSSGDPGRAGWGLLPILLLATGLSLWLARERQRPGSAPGVDQADPDQP